jgi:diamine N-acetyltransferase
MFIKNDTIFLRALEPSDLDVLYDIENNRDVWKVSNTIVPFSKAVLKSYLETQQYDIYTTKQLRLMICLKGSNDMIGTVDLFEFDPLHARVGVGIFIFEKYRQQGFAFRAIELIKIYTRENLLLNQIYCNINDANTESIHLFEKCGFQKIGLKKKWNRILQHQFEDEWMLQCVF